MSDDVSDEDRPQRRELRPLLFSNSVWVLRYVVVACVSTYQLTLAFNDQIQKKSQQKLKQHNFHFFEIAVN